MSGEIKRSVTIAGHRTSITLEPAFWNALKEIACSRGASVNEIVRRIDAARDPHSPQGLSSAIRVHVLEHFRAAAACPRGTDLPS